MAFELVPLLNWSRKGARIGRLGSLGMVRDGPADPISDQKYDPFLEAIELRNSDFGGAGTGWLVGWAGAGLVQDFSPLVLYCC